MNILEHANELVAFWINGNKEYVIEQLLDPETYTRTEAMLVALRIYESFDSHHTDRSRILRMLEARV